MAPITCHILDTASGAPAASVNVTLSLLSTPAASCPPKYVEVGTGVTNKDGRIAEWSSNFTIEDGQVYKLRFETWDYYKGKTFFPYVEVPFVINMTDGRDHYHVPLLLAPWSYSTYRGS
ncbi:hypothetical protein TWF506_008340 [Arthrobotrys conoides]|uniref:5-hydroxyisourate hydrolase n=1 Tax=Arthrobotrys conoides TaxID=74498 RepID=A0AAN8NLR8_9PEZI